MITTEYTPLAEIILQSFTNAHSLDNNGKEKLLIDLLNYVRDITELKNLILLIANDNKGKELDILINRYISDNSSVRQFLHKKGVNQIEYIFKNFEYPKSISRLVAMKMLLGKRDINSNLPVFKSLYNELSIYIDVRLHRLITYQKEQIQSKKYNRQCEKSNQMKHQTLDLLDAVGAFMVYEETQAYNILSHIGANHDDNSMYKMEVILSDCYIDYGNTYGLPHVYVEDCKVKIKFIDSQIINRNLKSIQFASNEILLTTYLDSNSLDNIEIFEEKLYLLLNYFNSSITERYIHIFVSTLQKKNIQEFGYGEAVYVRTLLIETIKANKDLNRKFILLLYFLKYDKELSTDIFCIRNVTKIIEVLSDYFPESTSLSYDSIKSYLTRKDRVCKNFNDFEQEVGNICHFSSDFIEKHRVLLNGVE